jgi:dipeptidyl aminopeptidase/acylaminoacyl peptidase
MRRMLLTCLLASVALFGAGCASRPSDPAIAAAATDGKLPPLVPLRRFVANIDSSSGYVLSPDGQKLLFSRVVGTDSGLAVRPVAGGPAVTFATGFLARPAGPTYVWLPDSRHVVYLKDLRGDENTQLNVFDSTQPFAPWAVTPWPGARSTFVGWGALGSSKFYFISNNRDKASMDLYEADAAARSVREVARSDGLITSWMIGTDRQLAGRYRQLGSVDGSEGVLEILQQDGSWKVLRTARAWDEIWVHRIDRGAGRLWMHSNLGRDKSALVEVDLASGTERVLGEHPEVDVGATHWPPINGGPLSYLTHAGLPRVTWLDQALGKEAERAVQKARSSGVLAADPVMVRMQNAALNMRKVVLQAQGDFDTAELLLDRDTGKVERLDPEEPEAAAHLARQEPFSFRASDGRMLHGYVTRPRGTSGPAPLVVNIHGGPWARDYWQPATFNMDQFMANRGYAVLRVNFRASHGYGRDYMMAGAKQSWGRTQQDVAEAVQWAVDQGIADRSRMAVLGASFGGYSVMAQLAQKRHDWRCGVNIVGVANWVRVIENWPPFWRNKHMFITFYGDPSVPAEREQMLAQSPISHVQSMTAPMLVIHGANDIRVLRQDSDEVVAALQKLGRPVDYLSFPNEGHSVTRWRNRLEMWRRIEDHFASCLGGRTAGWDAYELMPR